MKKLIENIRYVWSILLYTEVSFCWWYYKGKPNFGLYHTYYDGWWTSFHLGPFAITFYY